MWNCHKSIFSLCFSACLFKHKFKYTNLHSVSHITVWECTIFQNNLCTMCSTTTFFLNQIFLIENGRCFQLKIGYRLSRNTAEYVLSMEMHKITQIFFKIWRIKPLWFGRFFEVLLAKILICNYSIHFHYF